MKFLSKVGIICLLLGAVNVTAEENALYIWGGFSPERFVEIHDHMKSEAWANNDFVFREGLDKFAFDYIERKKLLDSIPEAYRSIDAYGRVFFKENGFVDENGKIRNYITVSEFKALNRGQGFKMPFVYTSSNQSSPATPTSSEAGKSVQLASLELTLNNLQIQLATEKKRNGSNVLIIDEIRAKTSQVMARIESVQSEVVANSDKLDKVAANLATKLKRQAVQLTKQIDAGLAGLRNEVQDKFDVQAKVNTKLQGEVGGLKEELTSGLSSLRKEVTTKFDAQAETIKGQGQAIGELFNDLGLLGTELSTLKHQIWIIFGVLSMLCLVVGGLSRRSDSTKKAVASALRVEASNHKNNLKEIEALQNKLALLQEGVDCQAQNLLKTQSESSLPAKTATVVASESKAA